MMTGINLLSIGSYNCRGFNADKQRYIKSLLSKLSVLFLQEHWLSDSQLALFSTLDHNFLFTGVSGFGNIDVLSGRPYGGCAILWRSDIAANVKVLDVCSNRVCAVRLRLDSCCLLLVCVYMPCEGDDSKTDEFANQLAVIESIVESNLDCHVIVGGDFNVDFSRKWCHTEMLSSFCESNGLHPAVCHVNNTVDYTYHFNMNRFNTIDHFLLSGALYEKAVNQVETLHEVDNTSDHEPLMLRLHLKTSLIGCNDKIYTPRVAWAKATKGDIYNYRSTLSDMLCNISVPTDTLLCDNPQCCDSNHVMSINTYANDITEACISAARLTVPLTCSRQQSRRIPGWSEQVQPMREKSLLWHRVWVECGRPHSGHVADCMRRSRASYHYCLRNVRKNEEHIVRERIANAMLGNEGRNFWAEIKRIRSHAAVISRSVDSLSDTASISTLFANKYRELYTSVPYDNDEMQRIWTDVNNDLRDSCKVEYIFPSDVRSAVSHLKAHKSDGCTSMTSDNIINAGDDCLVHIGQLLNAIMMHGALPDSFLRSTIVPIPKGRNVNRCDSANYRGISLSSVYLKIIDNIVLHKFSANLCTSELQFGFKRKSSSNLCTFVLKETLAYYSKNNSTVFCTFIDATKAFDRVKYCKLFRLLIDRGLPACIIRLLFNVYTSNFLRIVWCDAVSEYFIATNGVKQGGVLSPVLFCIYLDNLLVKLSESGVGCFIGKTFVGVLAYADDIVLVTPSASAMRKLLGICDAYAAEFSITFNASKSKCMVISPTTRRSVQYCDFVLEGKPMEFVSSYVHLGHLLTDSLRDSSDILKRRSDFVGQVNNVLCYFQKQRSDVKYKLFQAYCTSFYGCELWNLSCSELGDLRTAWRKGIRRVWGIPPDTHCYIIPLLCKCLPVFDEICRRSANFMRSCMVHNTNVVRSVANYGILFGRCESPVGRNVLYCMRRFNAVLSDILSEEFDTFVWKHVTKDISDEQEQSASLLKECILLRDGFLSLPEIFALTDIENIISEVCSMR